MSSDFEISDKWLKKLDRQTQEIASRTGVDRKTLDEVFDRTTLLHLGNLISHKIIDHFDFPISAGKESIVFRAITPQNTMVAIKIYRTSNLSFKHIVKYIEGDPRFSLTNKTRRGIIETWAKKEYKNLQRLNQASINAPKPIKNIQNILVMEYIGNGNQPAPLLKDITLKNPKKLYDTIIDFIQRMYQQAELIHADLSSYNILLHKEKPYIIDVGQAVILEHPQALSYLKRDIYNIAQFFKKYDIHTDENKLYTQITTSGDKA